MSIHTAVLAAAALIPSAGALAQIGPPAWTWDRLEWSATTAAASTATLGHEFTVSTPLTVAAIGIFDVETSFGTPGTARSFPGLAQPHAVALWNLSNTTTPLATATVAAGQVTPLCQDGYRYAPITPVALTPGNTYVVSAFWPQDDGSGNFDPYPDLAGSGTPVTFAPGVNVIQARSLTGGGPNQFPSTALGPGNAFIGLLNFRVGSASCEPNPAPTVATTFQ